MPTTVQSWTCSIGHGIGLAISSDRASATDAATERLDHCVEAARESEPLEVVGRFISPFQLVHRRFLCGIGKNVAVLGYSQQVLASRQVAVEGVLVEAELVL